MFTFYYSVINQVSLSPNNKTVNRTITVIAELNTPVEEFFEEPVLEEIKEFVEKTIDDSGTNNQVLEKESKKSSIKKVATTTYVADLSKAHDQTPEKLRALFSELIEEIHRKKRYPKLSKRLRESGVVHVKFEIDSQGNVKNVLLKKPCSYKRLNNSALKVVSNLELSVRPPKEYGKIEVTFPMSYVL